jgi:hypothetical protein
MVAARGVEIINRDQVSVIKANCRFRIYLTMSKQVLLAVLRIAEYSSSQID